VSNLGLEFTIVSIIEFNLYCRNILILIAVRHPSLIFWYWYFYQVLMNNLIMESARLY